MLSATGALKGRTTTALGPRSKRTQTMQRWLRKQAALRRGPSKQRPAVPRIGTFASCRPEGTHATPITSCATALSSTAASRRDIIFSTTHVNSTAVQLLSFGLRRSVDTLCASRRCQNCWLRKKGHATPTTYRQGKSTGLQIQPKNYNKKKQAACESHTFTSSLVKTTRLDVIAYVGVDGRSTECRRCSGSISAAAVGQDLAHPHRSQAVLPRCNLFLAREPDPDYRLQPHDSFVLFLLSVSSRTGYKDTRQSTCVGRSQRTKTVSVSGGQKFKYRAGQQ